MSRPLSPAALISHSLTNRWKQLGESANFLSPLYLPSNLQSLFPPHRGPVCISLSETLCVSLSQTLHRCNSKRQLFLPPCFCISPHHPFRKVVFLCLICWGASFLPSFTEYLLSRVGVWLNGASVSNKSQTTQHFKNLSWGEGRASVPAEARRGDWNS